MERRPERQPDPSLPLRWRLLRAIRAGDYVIAAIFFALACGSFWLPGVLAPHDTAGRTARIFVRNQLVAEVDLLQDRAFDLDGTVGRVTLAVAAGSIRVAASTCPNQYCLKQGAIRRASQVLVCVPNQLLVEIVSPDAANLDVITF